MKKRLKKVEVDKMATYDDSKLVKFIDSHKGNQNFLNFKKNCLSTPSDYEEDIGLVTLKLDYKNNSFLCNGLVLSLDLYSLENGKMQLEVCRTKNFLTSVEDKYVDKYIKDVNLDFNQPNWQKTLFKTINKIAVKEFAKEILETPELLSDLYDLSEKYILKINQPEISQITELENSPKIILKEVNEHIFESNMIWTLIRKTLSEEERLNLNFPVAKQNIESIFSDDELKELTDEIQSYLEYDKKCSRFAVIDSKCQDYLDRNEKKITDKIKEISKEENQRIKAFEEKLMPDNLVKDAVLTVWPHDDLAKEINPNLTFKVLMKQLSEGFDIYDVIGVGDSIIRENCMSLLASAYHVDNDIVYELYNNLGSEKSNQYIQILNDNDFCSFVDNRKVKKSHTITAR